MALAPWVSINCTQSYLASASFDNINGFIFYRPDNSTSEPPPVSDPIWTLRDGGRWKSIYSFPVYAIPGANGTFLMNQLSVYSGNTTSVPRNNEIEFEHPGYELARVTLRVNQKVGAQLPSLWVFLIIVLGCLIGIVGITSCVMHILQRRRRASLRRRVMAGEVNLEAIGMKRINVPKSILNKMPLVVYKASAGTTDLPKLPPPASVEGKDLTDLPNEAIVKIHQIPVNVAESSRKHEAEFVNSQQTCPICLDDFVDGETTIRELPCRHIFHPECVDGFLQKTSSLCPMCKKSVLPPGFCPAVITNAMVRRERLSRAIAERNGRIAMAAESPIDQIIAGELRRRGLYGRSLHRDGVRSSSSQAATVLSERARASSLGTLISIPRRVSQAVSGGRRVSSAPTPTPTTEMRSMDAISTSGSAEALPRHSADMHASETSRRRASAANRLIDLVSQRRTAEDEEMERQRRMPKCESLDHTISAQ